MTSRQSRPKYGELVLLGHNGQLPRRNRGRKRSKFVLSQRPVANGVKPLRSCFVDTANLSNRKKNVYQITYAVSKTMTVVTDYDRDESSDMFQIGRSSSSSIDFVIDASNLKCTISRFACRIVVDRNKPYTARIYATGFDESNKAHLSEATLKWKRKDDCMDGLTTNGVLIAHPNGEFCGGESVYRCWREVSVAGDLYSLREDRKTQQMGTLINSENNILKDGTLINLCGATLLWRSADGLVKSPGREDVEELVNTLNDDRLLTDLTPHEPFAIFSMELPRQLNSPKETVPQPYFHVKCGHVQVYKKAEIDATKNVKCSACGSAGIPKQLCMGLEPAFYVDYGPPTYAFNPCGHIATEKTIKYWANVEIPEGVSSFIAMCPFCAVPLDGWPGYVELQFSFVLNGTV